jgi:hypothetical protein
MAVRWGGDVLVVVVELKLSQLLAARVWWDQLTSTV